LSWRSPLFSFPFFTERKQGQAKFILPALADPAAEGDPAYPVLF